MFTLNFIGKVFFFQFLNYQNNIFRPYYPAILWYCYRYWKK